MSSCRPSSGGVMVNMTYLGPTLKNLVNLSVQEIIMCEEQPRYINILQMRRLRLDWSEAFQNF